jgi:hypothetical protein
MYAMLGLCVATLVVSLLTVILWNAMPLVENQNDSTMNNFAIMAKKYGVDLLTNTADGLYIIVAGSATMLVGKLLWKMGMNMLAQLVKLAGAVLLIVGSLMVLISYSKADLKSANTGAVRTAALSAFVFMSAALAIITLVPYSMHMMKMLSKK